MVRCAKIGTVPKLFVDGFLVNHAEDEAPGTAAFSNVVPWSVRREPGRERLPVEVASPREVSPGPHGHPT